MVEPREKNGSSLLKSAAGNIEQHKGFRMSMQLVEEVKEPVGEGTPEERENLMLSSVSASRGVKSIYPEPDQSKPSHPSNPKSSDSSVSYLKLRA